MDVPDGGGELGPVPEKGESMAEKGEAAGNDGWFGDGLGRGLFTLGLGPASLEVEEEVQWARGGEEEADDPDEQDAEDKGTTVDGGGDAKLRELDGLVGGDFHGEDVKLERDSKLQRRTRGLSKDLELPKGSRRPVTTSTRWRLGKKGLVLAEALHCRTPDELYTRPQSRSEALNGLVSPSLDMAQLAPSDPNEVHRRPRLDTLWRRCRRYHLRYAPEKGVIVG